jgi:hypothetical protein
MLANSLYKIEVMIKGKMLENTLNDMVDNDKEEVPYLLPAIEGEDYGYEGEGSGSTMNEGMPSTEAPMVPFNISRALVEEYKAKIEKLELDNLEKGNIINVIYSSSK